MTPDAKRRMEIYQEGQRAFNRRTMGEVICPYSDWRAGTWLKGYRAAKDFREAELAAVNEPIPPTPYPMNVYFRNEDELRAFVGQHRHLLEDLE